MAGLSDDIQTEMRLFGPRSVEQMMDLAQKIEAKNWALSGEEKPIYPTYCIRPTNPNQMPNSKSGAQNEATAQFDGSIKSNKLTQPNSSSSETQVNHSSSSLSANSHQTRRNSTFKRLSPAEIQTKMDQGLCFRCDEKYGPHHRCRFKQLRVLLMGADDEEEVIAEGGSMAVSEIHGDDFNRVNREFRDFHLEDKVVFRGGSNVRTSNIVG